MAVVCSPQRLFDSGLDFFEGRSCTENTDEAIGGRQRYLDSSEYPALLSRVLAKIADFVSIQLVSFYIGNDPLLPAKSVHRMGKVSRPAPDS